MGCLRWSTSYFNEHKTIVYGFHRFRWVVRVFISVFAVQTSFLREILKILSSNHFKMMIQCLCERFEGCSQFYTSIPTVATTRTAAALLLFRGVMLTGFK